MVSYDVTRGNFWCVAQALKRPLCHLSRLIVPRFAAAEDLVDIFSYQPRMILPMGELSRLRVRRAASQEDSRARPQPAPSCYVPDKDLRGKKCNES